MSPPSRRPHGDEPGAPVYGQRLSRFEREPLRAPRQLEKVTHPAGSAADLNDVAPQNSGRRDLDVGYQRTPEGPVTHRASPPAAWSCPARCGRGRRTSHRSPAGRPAPRMATLPYRPRECQPCMQSTGRQQPRIPIHGAGDEEALASTCQSHECFRRQSRRHNHQALACTLPLPGQHVRPDERIVLAQKQV